MCGLGLSRDTIANILSLYVFQRKVITLEIFTNYVSLLPTIKTTLKSSIMSKYTHLLLFFFLAVSCKVQDKSSPSSPSTDSETIFSLKSTSCMGQCPEYEIIIKADSTIFFEGKKYTTVIGDENKKLSSEEYDEIMGVIKKVEWSKLNKKYVSQMSDLPSYSFFYSTGGVQKRVYQYGNDPKSLNSLRKALLPIIDNKDFF